MPPAATNEKTAMCEMPNPPPPVSDGAPHGVSLIVGPGVETVSIGGMPASVVGDTVECPAAVPPVPNEMVKGSTTVMIGGRPSVRIGDETAHGGTVDLGVPTVMIGG